MYFWWTVLFTSAKNYSHNTNNTILPSYVFVIVKLTFLPSIIIVIFKRLEMEIIRDFAIYEA